MTEQEYANNRQNVRFLLLGHYLDLFQLNNQKVVYEKNIEQTRLLVKDMQASYRQGTALKSDITRYELQLQNLELALTSVKDKIDIFSVIVWRPLSVWIQGCRLCRIRWSCAN